jgi:hypothetical protein
MRILIGRESGSKDGELETKGAALGRGEIARPIPPFVAKLGVRAMVIGEAELAPLDGSGKTVVVGPPGRAPAEP